MRGIPAPVDRDVVLPDFAFADGATLPAVRVRVTTLGDPAAPPVLVLHGTGASGRGLLTAGFAGTLFGPGQPLDAARHFLILPDALGAGASAKPSDGLRTAFPRYTYADMVRAQFRLVTEGLGLGHLRLVLGNSMGGMHAWLWGIAHPGFMDALVPMACLPAAMGGRNWMLRRLLVDAVRSDPAWQGGAYVDQPPSLSRALAWFEIATSGGTLALHAGAPDPPAADAAVAALLAERQAVDANDLIHQIEAGRDYDPSAALERITAPVLAIVAADDERNPPELGILEAAARRLPRLEIHLIPASRATRGHATTVADAGLYADRLARFLRSLPT